MLQPMYPLTGFIDHQLAVAPFASRRKQLKRIVVLRRRSVTGIKLDGGGCKSALRIADLGILVLFSPACERNCRGPRAAESGGRTFLDVTDTNMLRRFTGGFRRFAHNDRNDLSRMPDTIGFKRGCRFSTFASRRWRWLQVVAYILMCKHVDESRRRACLLQLESRDSATGDSARDQECMSGIGRNLV